MTAADVMFRLVLRTRCCCIKECVSHHLCGGISRCCRGIVVVVIIKQHRVKRSVGVVSYPCAEDPAGENVAQVWGSTVRNNEAFYINFVSIPVAEFVKGEL
jgi:hypothetical protein